MYAKFSGFLPPPPCLHFGTIHSTKFMQPPLLRLLFGYTPLPPRPLPLQTSDVQGSTNRRALGFVNFVLALAYHFCLNLLAAFSQPGARLLVEPCTCPLIFLAIVNALTSTQMSAWLWLEEERLRASQGRANHQKIDLQIFLSPFLRNMLKCYLSPSHEDARNSFWTLDDIWSK